MIANLVVTLLLLFTVSSAKVFTDCELANALENAGFPKDQLKDWICLAKAESSLNTTAVGGPNKNGSYDYGLFQINDHIWCDPEKRGGDCNVKCSDLVLEDDIGPSMNCAKIVYKVQGFKAWYGWIKKCKGKRLPPLVC